MTSYETILCEVSDGAARITLNRPESLNSWTLEFGRELLDAVSGLAVDPEVRAVLITGAGRGFSSGADLRGEDRPVTAEGKPDVHTPLSTLYNPIIKTVREMPKPVIAAVNGPAVGVGCSLALASDLVIAAESAYFLLAFANIGLTLDGGASVSLIARLGYARAVEMAMLAEKVPAAQALEWGLINQVVTDDELASVSGDLLDRLARGATMSFTSTKRLLNRAAYSNLDAQLALEAELQQTHAESHDFMEGVFAFMQKRPPEFSGS